MADRPEFPESYKDPLYASLDSATEQKLEIPPGLLSSVRTYGERSNHSQTNDEKTFGVYQFTPATRKAILDKYGVDVTLSPQNASLGAGYLLQEGLKRNGNDPAQAVGEYIGGLNRDRWGPTTKGYMARVLAGWKAQQPAPAQGGSTFDRVQASMQPAIPPDAISRVYAAYQTGQMTPQERADFEADVNAGKVMLPKGASLQGAAADNVLPMPVVQAYFDGKMTPEEKMQLQQDVKSGAVKLPGGVLMNDKGDLNGTPAASLIPGNDKTPVVPPEPTLGQKAVGAGEAALSTATGLTGGALGMAGGAAKGLVDAVTSGQYGTPEGVRAVEEAATNGANALTYAPRTPAGQDMAQSVGNAMQQAVPVLPLTGELATAGQALQAARPAAAVTARAGAAAAQDAGKTAAGAVSQAAQAVRDKAVSMTSEATQKLLKLPEEEPQAAGQMGSVGAAGTDPAAIRRATAQQLPVPMELTTGQATRNPNQMRFEGETAKGELGQPLRENSAKQNAQLAKNFEALIDSTGAEAPNVIEAGRAVVDNGLVPAAARLRAQYRAQYQAARRAGEMETPVSTAPLVQYLQENASLNQSSLAGGALGLLERELVRLGALDSQGAPRPAWTDFVGQRMGEYMKTEGGHAGAMARISREWQQANGNAFPETLSLNNMELLRRQMNNAIDAAPDNATNMRAGAQIKELIDQATDGLGGDLYKDARRARMRYAQLFENNAIVRDLMRNRRGTADRQVALEDVFRRTILNGSRDDLSMLRRTLQVAGGEEGHQAWRELQGQTLRHMLDKATENVATDMTGAPIFSAAKLQNAIRGLDVDGRLDFVLGKQRAQMVRDINEIAKVVTTFPPGTLNTSNTASVLLAAIAEAGATGGLTGLPIPVLSTIRLGTKYVRDRTIRQRVMAALGKAEASAKKVKAPKGVVPKPSDPGRMPESRTVH